ncbi:MAG: (2Fe-2S)-binding protein [bacterium]
MNDDLILICRCEDVTLADIRKLLKQGYVTVEDLKRQLRIGMGPCQGSGCGLLLQREVAAFLKKNVEDIPLGTIRPLTTGIKLKSIAEAVDEK